MLRAEPIYVETRICGDMDTLWQRTQEPDLHQRWDVRFTEITYLPRTDPAEPQQFLYATRIGFGLRVAGQGECLGDHSVNGGRTSSLRFWSTDPKSLIAEGSGYWKYVQTDEGVRFVTAYNYVAKFGLVGRAVDLVFRPLLGWATAWSFDCLRLWIERGIAPESSIERSLVHAVCRTSLATVWIYQGVVPKLLFGERSGELDTIRAAGVFAGHERALLNAIGVVEILVGLALLILWRTRSLLLAVIVALLLLGFAAVAAEPALWHRQFNPVTLNISMIALAAVGWWVSSELPSAARCLRRQPASAGSAEGRP